MGRKGKGNSSNPIPIGRPINASASIAQGIVLACPINEGTLTTIDYAQGAVGIPTVAPVRNTRGYAQAASSRINFSLGNPKNVASTNTSPFTVSVWIKNSGTANSANLWGWGSTGAGIYCGINQVGSGLLNFDYFDGTRYIRCNTSVAIPSLTNAVWTHVVCTRDNTNAVFPANTQKIYINGVDVGATFNGGGGIPNTVTTLPFSIGSRGTAGSVFTGLINNVMIWNRQLSQTEVRQLYTNPYCIYK